VRALLRHAIESDGHATWIGLRRLEGTEKCDVGPLDATERLRLARVLARVGDEEATALARRAARRALGEAALRLPRKAFVKACRPASLEHLRRDVLGFFVEMAAQGDIAHVHIAGRDVYLASTPSAAREVLVRRADVFSKGHSVGIRPAETSTHAHVAWLHQVGQILRRWDPPQADAPRHLSNPLKVTVAMRELSLDVIGRAMFGDAFTELRSTAAHYADRVVRFAPAPLGGLEPPIAAPPDFLDAERDFTRRMEMLEPAEHTLFHRLHGMQNARGERIETAYALEVARVVLLGGFDTVATLLTWTIVLLAQHPQPPEVDDMWILSEVLRLYPPAWCLSRRARVDVSLQGHDVKAGSLMLVSLWQLQRDARSFPDPDRFDPLRWAPGNATHVREAYAPFGFGPRRCIGEAFGWTHASRLLRHLRARWRFVLRDEKPIRPTVMLVLRPPEDLTVDLVEIS
jgi:cytochrome P450